MTALEICNMALGLLGQEAITSGQLATPTNKASRQCLMHYAAARKHILSKRAWSFASKWASVSRATDSVSYSGYVEHNGRLFTPPDDPGCPYLFPLDVALSSTLRILACTDADGNPETAWRTGKILPVQGSDTYHGLSNPLGITAGADGLAGDSLSFSQTGFDPNHFPHDDPTYFRDTFAVADDDAGTNAVQFTLDWPDAGTLIDDTDWGTTPQEYYYWTRIVPAVSNIDCLFAGREADSLLVLYAFDPAVADIPDDVCNVIAHELASRMAVPLTENLKLRSELLALGKQYYLEAASLDGSQMSPIPVRVQPANSILYKRRA